VETRGEAIKTLVKPSKEKKIGKTACAIRGQQPNMEFPRMKRLAPLATIALLAICSAAAADAPPGAEQIAAKLKMDYGYGVFTAGMDYVSVKDLKYARAAFDVAVENDNSLGRAYFHRGDLRFGKNDFAGAIKDYDESLKHDPDFFLAYYNMACAAARLGDKAKALACIEEALKLGYNRFEMLEKDDDLKAAREGPEFAALLDKYRKQPVAQTATVKFLLAKTAEEKLAVIEAAAADKAGWKPVADKALLDSDESVRVGGLKLYVDCDGEGKLEMLVRGLFDNNGYVNKFAGNVLVVVGDAAVPWMDAIIASDYKGAQFYAKQVKKLLEAKKAKDGKPPG